MGKLRFISPCIEFATSVFPFFNKTKGNFIVIFSIAVKNQNSIFIKYIKKREISWKVFIFQSTKRFLSYLPITREELVFLDDVRMKLES